MGSSWGAIKTDGAKEDRGVEADSPEETLPDAYPTLDEICSRGAYYLLQDKGLVRRHVETISINSHKAGRRRLTIDIALPREKKAAIAKADDGYRFYVPIALMAKDPPTTHIDLVDEEGSSMPLLTREQNAKLTLAAVEHLARDLLGEEPTTALSNALRHAIEGHGLAAEFAMEYAFHAATEQRPGVLESSEGVAFVDVVTDFSANSLIWVGLSGRPGARRVIKLSYDITMTPPPIPRRPGHEETVLVRTPAAEYEFSYTEQGDGHPHSSARRLLGRILTTFGQSSLELEIPSPYLRGCESYHVQIDAPPGLEARDIRLAGELTKDDGTPAVAERRVMGGVAHLYFHRARAERFAFIVFSINAGRRGFLSLSLIAATITAAVLWAFHLASFTPTTVETTGVPGGNEVAAGILLVIPAFLASLAVRPDDHVLTTRLLGGVRLLVVVTALISAAAAAAIIDVKPTAWNVDDAWAWYAKGSSVVVAIIAFAWLLSFSSVGRLGSRLRERLASRGFFFLLGMSGISLGLVAVATGAAWPELIDSAELGVVVVLLIGGCVSALVASNAGLVDPPDGAGKAVPGVMLLGALTLFVSVPFVSFDESLGISWEDVWPYLLPSLAAISLALCILEAFVRVSDSRK